VVGIAAARIAPEKFEFPATHAASVANTSTDELSAPHPDARFSWGRLLCTLAIGVALWLAAMALLIWLAGWEGTLVQMGAFFTKAALVTFGGAYAVLPYVNEAAVEQFQWVTGPQMIDGMALGETTPGPLIMVLTFVGYVGAWTHAAGMPPAWAGLAGALVVTFFTFLPSFILVFAGAPLVEATRRRRMFTVPLTAITAAVVGVIANLAVYFASHVFWPAGLTAGPDWKALSIAVAAAIALFASRLGVVPVILGCGVAGLLVNL
jgi:chromate transporter